MNCIQNLIPDKPDIFNTKHRKSSCGDVSFGIKTGDENADRAQNGRIRKIGDFFFVRLLKLFLIDVLHALQHIEANIHVMSHAGEPWSQYTGSFQLQRDGLLTITSRIRGARNDGFF